nr:hypothetical protein [Xenococcaceae cyanobacterium MO_188.B19]
SVEAMFNILLLLFTLLFILNNLDANGSLNIGFKTSKHKLFERVSRVCLTQPVRVNVLQDSPSIAQP